MLSKRVLKNDDISLYADGTFLYCYELGKGFVKRNIFALNLNVDYTFEHVVEVIETLDKNQLEALNIDSVVFANGEIAESMKRSFKVVDEIASLAPLGTHSSFVDLFIVSQKAKSRYFNLAKLVAFKSILDEANFISDELIVVSENTIINTFISSNIVAIQNDEYNYEILNYTDKFVLESGKLKLVGTLDYETRHDYVLDIKISDKIDNAKYWLDTITVNVTNIPDFILISNNRVLTVSENPTLGTIVGDLNQFITAEEGLEYSFEVINNNKFSVTGSNLNVIGILDYEDADSHIVTIKINYGIGLSKTITTDVIVNVLNLPDEIELGGTQSVSIIENNAQGITIANLNEILILEQGLNLDYVLMNNTQEFEIAGSLLKSKISLDFENKTNYVLAIRAIDTNVPTNYLDFTFTVNVTNMGDTLSIDQNRTFEIMEDLDINTNIGNLSNLVVLESGLVVSYELMNNTDKFYISGSNIFLKESLDYETTSSYVVSIKMTDVTNASRFWNMDLNINIGDVEESGAIVFKTGGLYATGDNSYSQLGTGIKLIVPKLSDWTENGFKNVSNGGTHTMAVKNDGTLWGCGQNSVGCVSPGGANNIYAPIQVNTSILWDKVFACYYGYTYGIATTGKLYGWGTNYYGNVASGTAHVTAITEITDVGGNSIYNVEKIIGHDHDNGMITYVKKSNGELFFSGVEFGRTDKNGKLQRVNYLSNINDVAVGRQRGAAILANGGGLAVWDNQISHENPNIIPGDWIKVAIRYQTFFAIKSDGTLWVWGRNSLSGEYGNGVITTEYTQPTLFNNDTDWVDVYASHNGTFLKKSNGQYYFFGTNATGLSLDGNLVGSTSIATPINIPENVSFQLTSGNITLLTSDGIIKAAGTNGSGQTGTNFITLSKSLISHNNTQNWTKLPNNVFGKTSAVIKADGSLWTFGYNNYGQIGNGSKSSSNFNIVNPFNVLNNVNQVSCGTSHMMAIKNDGTLWAWGYNSSGQLGLGDTTERLVPVQVGTSTWSKVICGNAASIAIKSDGTLWGFGNNSTGLFGIGTTSTSNTTPVLISGTPKWTDIYVSQTGTTAFFLSNEYEMYTAGSNVNGITGIGITSGTTTTMTKISGSWNYVSAGFATIIARKTDGKWFGWGQNTYGQRLVGTSTTTSTPSEITSITNISKVVMGYNNSFVFDNSGNVYATGLNSKGELGLGTTINAATPTIIPDSTFSDVVAANAFTLFLK